MERPQVPLFTLITMLLLAANLRTPITALGPLLTTLQQHFELSATATGVLASTPLLIFALMSPLSARLARKMGLKAPLTLALLLVLFGLALRSCGYLSGLYTGTVIFAAGIAIANVLLPSWVKSQFGDQAGPLTALYAFVMAVVASLFSALSVPLAGWFNWQLALAAPAVFTLIALLGWLKQSDSAPLPTRTEHRAAQQLWKQPLAWQITFFMGLSSLIFYVFINWLPAMLVSAGLSTSRAGFLDGILQLASALPGLALTALFRRVSMQKLTVSHALGVALAMAGLTLLPTLALFWVILLGYCGGAVFIIALTLMSVRARDAMQAASLSAMAQFFGYLLACIGPTLAGWVHDSTASWHPVQGGIVAAALVMAGCGYFASRDRTMSVTQQSAPAEPVAELHPK